MFVKTHENSLINFDGIMCCDIVKIREVATIKAKSHNGYDFEIYRGTFENTETAFDNLTEAIIKGASLIDFSGRNND